MKRISIDNGRTFIDAEQALEEMAEYTADALDAMLPYMEEEAKDKALYEDAPFSDLEFLKAYLKHAENDLVIG